MSCIFGGKDCSICNKDDLQDDIDYILTCFDFDKVRKTMLALTWSWYDTEGEAPSYYRLIKRAEELLRDAWRNKHTIGSGGFVAEYSEGTLELRFEVTSWNSYKG